MSSLLTARTAFVIAIGLLLACALLVYGTLVNFTESERLVVHSLQVQGLLGETESAIASAARDRLTYVFNGDVSALSQYQQAVARIAPALAELRRTTMDDPVQQANCDRLEGLANERLRLWEKSVALKKSGLPAPPGQLDMTPQGVAFADEIISVTQAMRAEESRLLQGRKVSAILQFLFVRVILVVSFIAAIWLLFWHYRLLRDELHAREQAEQAAEEAAKTAMEAERKAHTSEYAAHESHQAAQRLSARLLQLRDDERRKFSRELHDSIGQGLAAAKMVLSSLAVGHENERGYSECLNLLDQAIKETRTISHLLHPPGLDRELEIALFRVLQESLANIHRHSQSSSAEIRFEAQREQVTLTVQDHGTGISKEVIDRFRSSGTSGVGLAGMRERIRELGGTFQVESSDEGTCVQVVVPLAGQRAFAAMDLS